jgi:hypothetical protein
MIVYENLLNLLLMFSSFTIAAALIYIVSHRSDISLKYVYILFATFFIAAGLMRGIHYIGILYDHSTVIEYIRICAMTIVVILEVATALLLTKDSPKIVRLPSHKELEEALRSKWKAELEAEGLEVKVKALEEEITRKLEDHSTDTLTLQKLVRLREELQTVREND